MKKIWKTFLAATVLSITACLFMGIAVFAETVSGEIKTDNGKGVYFTWEFDTETQTLTVEQPMKIVNYADGEAWKEYEKDIRHVILKDHAFEIWGIDYAEDITMEAGSGFSWTLDMASRTVTLNGTGDWAINQNWPDDYIQYYDTIVISDGLGRLTNHEYATGSGYEPNCRKLVIGKNTYFPTESSESVWLHEVWEEFEVHPDNPYYTVYDECLYTKDMKILLFCPTQKTDVQFPTTIVSIGPSAFFGVSIPKLIIPWGVTTIDGPFNLNRSTDPNAPTILVFPDTITDYRGGNFVARAYDEYMNIYYPRNNQALAKGLAVSADEFNWHPVLYPLDSMAEFYPGHAAEPSTPEESKPEPSKPAESSKPAEPSSKPADTSKPAQTASKPASQPQAESSAEQEKPSSAPAQNTIETESFLQEESMLESSTPEISEQEDSLESSEESLESSEEPSDESSLLKAPGQASGGVSWAIPLICAMGAVAIVAAVILLILWKRK